MTLTEEGIQAGADVHAIGATRPGGYDGVIQATSWCGHPGVQRHQRR